MKDMVRKQFVASIDKLAESGDRVRRFVISTSAVDRDNDTIDQTGWQLDNYKSNPVVLWAHDYSQLPVGRALSVGMEGANLVSTVEFADHDFANTVLRLVDGGFLRATSVGFRPTKLIENVERGGLDFKEQELLEFSIVPVPANPQALITMSAEAQQDLSFVTKWAEGWLKGLNVQKVPVQAKPTNAPEFLEAEDDPVRWNRSLSKAFDVDGEPLEASKLEYTWVSRYLGAPVKDLYETTLHVGGARMGSFLSALEDGLAAYQTASVRNFDHRGEKEVPPVYETMQLNSKLTRSFLVEGLRFVHGPMKMAVKVQPSWAGLAVTSYIQRDGAGALVAFLAEAQARAATYKYLKGEAFSVSGEFLHRDGTSWEDLFLSADTLEPLRRTVELLNTQGKDMDARGQILMGPPGTGKTLAARVMMNQAKDATFIWVSNRDLTRMGSFGGLTQAFDLAAENAPAVVLLEDVDHDIAYHVDLLKTELDGLKRKQGVVTVLTTNHPEMLPEALIDRPGRFHDVLAVGLPGEDIRRAMLAKWAPDASAEALDALAKDTAGMAGAHLRELVRFADVIRAQDGLDVGAALTRAFEKLTEQRAVIDAARGERRYRAVKALKATMSKQQSHATTEDITAAVADVLKAGRKLSKANETRLRQAQTLLAEVLAQLDAPAADEKDEKALCEHGNYEGECEECKAAKALCPHDADASTCPQCSGKAAETETAMVLELADEDGGLVLDLDDDDGSIDIDMDVFRAAFRDAVREAVGGVVRDATANTLARMRGRVD